MSLINTPYWKRLWRWVTSQRLTDEELVNALDNKSTIDFLHKGIAGYQPTNIDKFKELQSKYQDHTKLLSVVQTLQIYLDIDCFQIWDIINHYLCNVSYGTPEKALKNVAFVDTRPSFLVPNVWKFYYEERLFMLKLLQYMITFKSDPCHKHHKQFSKVFSDIGISNLKKSLIQQFEKLLSSAPPLRKINSDFHSDTVRQEWATYILREQVTILQILMLANNECHFTHDEFLTLFKLFKKHNFGKNQSFGDLLDDKKKESLRVMYMELGLILVALDGDEIELTKLEPAVEQSPMLLSWMMFTLQSEQHGKMFETKYQQYGATALRLRVFEFLLQMLNDPLYNDKSKCADIIRDRVFRLMNYVCDKFDADGTISCQPGVMSFCGQLLKSPSNARVFWQLHQKDESVGMVSVWNSALEYFPYNFNALSTLAAGLAEAGVNKVYNPSAVSIISLQEGDAIIGRDYFPLGDPSYHIEARSKATIMERKEGTMIHFRTPYSYWTVFYREIEKALDINQRQQYIHTALEKVYEGTKILKSVLRALVPGKEIPKGLVVPSEGVFVILVRFMRAESPPLPLLVECLGVCTALLINTGLLPRVTKRQLSHIEYATGVSLDSAAVGHYLVTIEQPMGTYQFLSAYMDLLYAFHQSSEDERITTDVLLPGLVLILREVFPNIYGWRYTSSSERGQLINKCATYFTVVLQDCKKNIVLKKICVQGLMFTENALELLKIVSMGNENLERLIHKDTNWISGPAYQYTFTLQYCMAVMMLTLTHKSLVCDAKEVTPLEQLVFAQNKHTNSLRVVPRVTSYINHPFNKRLSVLSCRLLKKFADLFQMSLFASLEMSSYQVRVMFLDRLRDDNEIVDLKIVILEFVATCIGKQPGLTEAFFMINHIKAKAEESKEKNDTNESFEGILGYMADYLETIKADSKLLNSPLLGCIMGIFHALWKNNMQILVKKLCEHPKFWEHLSSPLFSAIQPGLKTYSQIFNVLSIELFVSRDKLDPNFKDILEQFFDTNKKHLDSWVNYIFSFKNRDVEEQIIDEVPVWLGLLTSWKDFTTVYCKCLPFSLNIAHKAKIVGPCMTALSNELEELKDSRLVVILAELYVIMLSNWKDDCFENRKACAKQIDSLLTNVAIHYEDLHPRAVRAILSIATVAISSLDYEIKANSGLAQSIIRSVTNINSLELENLFNNIRGPTDIADADKAEREEVPSIVLCLAMLEQCLDFYDDLFSGLSQWFQSTKFTNKLLCCLQICLQNRRHYHTSLAALRCLTAYARGPFSKDLLLADVDQFLWLQLLPPKTDADTNSSGSWKAEEWWKVYGYSLDFISTMVMKHGQLFAGDAITFVGVHLEYLVEAVLLLRQSCSIDILNLCASTLTQYQCVPVPVCDVDAACAPIEVLEVLHMAAICLLSFSPDLLSLLADPLLDLERWQPIVELHFGAPKITYEPFPQLTFGTLLSAICLLTRSLNHTYHTEDGSRSPRGRRRACSCGSPGEPRRVIRSESVASVSSVSSALPPTNERLLAGALQATALLTVRDPHVASRHKQLVRRELASELTVFHDFVRKRILCAAHNRPHLARNKLGAWPLVANEEEIKRIEEARRERHVNDDDDRMLPPPPPPKRSSQDSMREFILRKHFLDKFAQTPTKPLPVSHSTPASDKKKETSRSLKRVSWAETPTGSDESIDSSSQETEAVYSNLTDVQINNDEDYFHFMSIVFL
ncbi:unnamed protein product, partial [Leptidea sinapis]